MTGNFHCITPSNIRRINHPIHVNIHPSFIPGNITRITIKMCCCTVAFTSSSNHSGFSSPTYIMEVVMVKISFTSQQTNSYSCRTCRAIDIIPPAMRLNPLSYLK